MALSQKLLLRQSQSLVMTPQLMQAIKLLQLSNLDLVAYVDAELERNPLLERDDRDDATGFTLPAEGASDAAEDRALAADVAEERPDWLETRLEVSPDAIAERLDTDLANVFPDDHGAPAGEAAGLPPVDPWSTPSDRHAVSSDDYNLEAFVAEERSLAALLGDQLGLAVIDPGLRLIGQALIDEIDEAGYMRASLEAVASRLGAPLEQVEDALAILQTFEPTGIAARDLADCLAIQLRERGRLDAVMRTLIGHLDLVARRDMSGLKRLCGIGDEDLAERLRLLRTLDPKPGSAFGSAPIHPVVPDVVVRAAPDGSWRIELNTDTLPRVLVNQSYYSKVARRSKGEDRTYLSECLQTANWLVKSLDQRARTILKVATEIVRQQDAFLAHGVAHLRPLNLKTVAEAIAMHESTVSRVTSNKYMATPRGVFELKYFFTASIASSEGGEAHSAEAVRHRIKALIDAETPDDVLSDDTLVKMLRDSGIDIARRTVAKYREALRIPSSVQRRREKQAVAAC
ncbi:RNA polymerase factor sigma-54 [Kaistia nematophila]|uniref:RNA polymerase sigma-54 factor n=1 Tax=Kaistia nematophila TaxID=2994654 RepID=A0A9X3IJT1_9HYPH|nr:RNA polymerase factor sigma-54 [Kaistia nematophila]MCX5567756.1 RNA polymerase factor sigma-54 [Kaistia nematophila]